MVSPRLGEEPKGSPRESGASPELPRSGKWERPPHHGTDRQVGKPRRIGLVARPRARRPAPRQRCRFRRQTRIKALSRVKRRSVSATPH